MLIYGGKETLGQVVRRVFLFYFTFITPILHTLLSSGCTEFSEVPIYRSLHLNKKVKLSLYQRTIRRVRMERLDIKLDAFKDSPLSGDKW